MAQEAEQLFEWLEKGAYFYVCGDKERMAKDVEQELLNIIATQGDMDADAAQDYLINLKEQDRYLRDVY